VPYTVSLDHQEVSDTCTHCGAEYPVTRGSLYADGDPIGLYVAGMHGCRAERSVALAIALRPTTGSEPSAVHLQAWGTPKEFQMVFIDPAMSPWNSHAYLGRMLGPEEARRDPRKGEFLHLATHVLHDNSAVRRYLGSDRSEG
jgi:hypothetical protein